MGKRRPEDDTAGSAWPGAHGRERMAGSAGFQPASFIPLFLNIPHGGLHSCPLLATQVKARRGDSLEDDVQLEGLPRPL